jgi:hypothetical protein
VTEENRILSAMDRAGYDTGLYSKFVVQRRDGSSESGCKHEFCTYFILDWEHDPYAVPAARAYADACEAKYPALAEDLRAKADEAAEKWGIHSAVEAMAHAPAGVGEDAIGGVACEPERRCTRCGLTASEIERAFDGYCDSTVPHPLGDQQSSQHHFDRPAASCQLRPDGRYDWLQDPVRKIVNWLRTVYRMNRNAQSFANAIEAGDWEDSNITSKHPCGRCAHGAGRHTRPTREGDMTYHTACTLCSCARWTAPEEK